MKISEKSIGTIVCLKNSEGALGQLTGKVLQFHQGPEYRDVDIELADGNVINTFDNNIEESNVVDVVKHGILKGIMGIIAKAG